MNEMTELTFEQNFFHNQDSEDSWDSYSEAIRDFISDHYPKAFKIGVDELARYGFKTERGYGVYNNAGEVYVMGQYDWSADRHSNGNWYVRYLINIHASLLYTDGSYKEDIYYAAAVAAEKMAMERGAFGYYCYRIPLEIVNNPIDHADLNGSDWDNEGVPPYIATKGELLSFLKKRRERIDELIKQIEAM